MRDLAAPRVRNKTDALASCNDGAYNLDGGRHWNQTYDWYLGDGARPANLTTSLTYSVLASAVNTITNTRNPCGLTDLVSASSSYQGVSTHESDIHITFGDSDCDFFTDRQNVIDFGDLANDGNPPVAATCTWYGSQVGAEYILEADIKFNVVDYQFTRDPGPNCTQHYDLESVAAHEFGHVYGLDHVDSDAHPTLTMRQGGSQCTTFKRDLGLGDVVGLRQLY